MTIDTAPKGDAEGIDEQGPAVAGAPEATRPPAAARWWPSPTVRS